MNPHRMGGYHTDIVRMAGTHEEERCEGKDVEEMHQRKVRKMTKSADGSAGLLHNITKPTMWSGGVQILKEKEDARLLDRSEAKQKNGQSIGKVMRKYRKCRASFAEMIN